MAEMMFRVQKLLQSEYDDFNEDILIENPFTEVTDDGIGKRQLYIGLTNTKIFIARDSFDSGTRDVYSCETDPEIETMVLLSLFPIEALHFNFIEQDGRQVMMVNFGILKTRYFEIGGHLLRNLFWNTWKDRISIIKDSLKETVQSFDSTTKEIIVPSESQVTNRSEETQTSRRLTPKKTSSISITGKYFKNFAKAFKPNEQKLLNRPEINEKVMNVKCCMLKGAVESLLGTTELITDMRNKEDLEDTEDEIIFIESDNFEECEAVKNKSMQNLFSIHHSDNNWY